MISEERLREFLDAEVQLSTSGPLGPADIDYSLKLIKRDFSASWFPSIVNGSGWVAGSITIGVLLPVVQSLGPNLAASAIWDGLKYLVLRYRDQRLTSLGPGEPPLQPDEPTVKIRVHSKDSEFKITAEVRTNDIEVLREALRTLPQLVKESHRRLPHSNGPSDVQFNVASKEWSDFA